VNTFALELWDDEGSRCIFYSVRWTDSVENETNKFFNRFRDKDHPDHESAVILYHLITHNIGERFGAADAFFDRLEDQAQALPPRPKRVFGIEELTFPFSLRLFCLRLSESVVVLFNGGIKDAEKIQDCDDLRMPFYEAKLLAQRIDDEVQAGMIIVNDRTGRLTDFQGNEDIQL
jgi:hypothetical protein